MTLLLNIVVITLVQLLICPPSLVSSVEELLKHDSSAVPVLTKTNQGSGSKCSCTPECNFNITKLDCPNSRVRARPDCPCCSVCARTLGDPCNLQDKPCDEEFGLFCGEQGKCQAKQTCLSVEDCPDDQFCLAGVCADPCRILEPCSTSLKNAICVTTNHRPVCSCPEGFNKTGDVCEPIKCKAGEVAYTLGDSRYEKNCTTKCTCNADGVMTCTNEFKCLPGFFRSGTLKIDSNCFENRNDPFADECCVTIGCSSTNDQEAQDVDQKDETTGNSSKNDTSGEGPMTCGKVSCGPNALCVKVNGESQCECMQDFEGDPQNITVGCSHGTANKDLEDNPVDIVVDEVEKTNAVEDDGKLKNASDNEVVDPMEDVTATNVTTPAPNIPSPAPGLNKTDMLSFNLTDLPLDSANVTSEKVPEDHQIVIVNITHNSTTVSLPSNEGGMLQVVPKVSYLGNGTLWQKKEIPSNTTVYTLTGLRPSTPYLIRWSKDGIDSPILTIGTSGGCFVPEMGVSYGPEEEFFIGCVEKCFCSEVGISQCQPRCSHRAGMLDNPNCTEVPDPDDPSCCVRHLCNRQKVLDIPDPEHGGVPKLIVTQKSHNSTSVAWDDFRTRSYTHGYVIEYRKEGEGPWIREEVSNSRPYFNINNLQPGTYYEIKVSVYENYDTKKLGISTETIVVKTKDGCVEGNLSFARGEEFFEGCKSRCICQENGTIVCNDRCTVPYFRAGSFSHDPLCFEQSSGEDDCCVIVSCAQSDGDNDPDPCMNILCGKNARCLNEQTTDAQNNTVTKGVCECNQGHVGNPADIVDGCKKASESCRYSNKTYLPGETFFDGCEYKCICALDGEIKCQPRCEVKVDGTNSRPDCLVVPDPVDECCGKVVCDVGSTSGSNGSGKLTIPFDGCVYKNVTYQKNESFSEDCISQCRCMGYGDVVCLPRCPPTSQVFNDSNCTTLPDPTDPCCSITLCANDTQLDVMKAQVLHNAALNSSVHSLSDVCTSGNQSYASGVEFNIGCDFKCLCLGGNVTQCISRCPPQGEIPPDQNCRESIDPNDICCKIIKCKDENVTKATDDLEKMENVTVHSPPLKNTTEHQMSSTAKSATTPAWSEARTPKISLSGDAKVTLDRVVAVNESAVQILMTVSEPVMNYLELDGSLLEVLYGEDRTNVKQQFLTIKDVHQEGGILGFEVGGLRSKKQYFFKVKVADTTSNFVPVTVPDVGAKISKPLVEDETVHSRTRLGNQLCSHKGDHYKVGDDFYDGCESFCRCGEDLQIECHPIECPENIGLEYLDVSCMEWLPDPSVEVKAPNCCPRYICTKESSCMYEGVKYNNFDRIPEAITGCDHRCYCEYGEVNCHHVCEDVSNIPPKDLPCPIQLAKVGLIPGDNCCMEWQCPQIIPNRPPGRPGGIFTPQFTNGHPPFDFSFDHSLRGPPQYPFVHREQTNERPAAECFFDDHFYPINTQWEVGPSCRAMLCSCFLLPNGSAHVHCEGGCSPIPVHLLEPNEECTRPHLVTPRDPCLCPYITCNMTAEGDGVSNLTAAPIDDKNVHVTFIIPSIYVGLFGEVDIAYTDDQFNQDPKSWEHEIFSPPGGVFDTSRLQFTLTDLKPATEYNLMVQVYFAKFSNVAKSTVVRVKTMPEQTSTVPTTTLPPKIMVDAGLKVLEPQPQALKIQWRKFTDFEMQLIDGFQLRYRKTDFNAQTWTTTPFIHRENTEYNLQGLDPNTKYEIDIAFLPFPNQTTDLISITPLQVETPPVKDPYDFDLVLKTSKVGSNNLIITWSGVPEPEKKYVHIYNVHYKADQEIQALNTFVLSKDNKESELMTELKNLKSSTKYQVWIEAFLTSGKTKQSNVLEIVTKPGLPPEPSSVKASLGGNSESKENSGTSYYGAMVAASIIATMAVLAFLTLLAILVRKQNTGKAKPAVVSNNGSQQAYDNPAFKVI